MIRAAVFDLGGVLEIVDDDSWQDQWIARWEGIAGALPGTLRSSPYVGPAEADFRSRVSAALEGARAAGWHAVLHESTDRSIATIRQIISSPPR
ncbi:MAG: hypothetical protein KF761_04430 [Salinibacterium sp.]|nr:hypothetical protein [Salinibacterium sp.]